MAQISLRGFAFAHQRELGRNVFARVDEPQLGQPGAFVGLAFDADVEAPAPPAVRRIDSPEPEPVNLLDAAGSSVGKRVGPILAAVAVLWLLKKLLSRRRT